MPRFSEVHKLNATQAELDFVDVSNEFDLRVYVDPYAIEIRTDPWSVDCANSIRDFFSEVLGALRDGQRGVARNLMSNLREPRETFLGISRGVPAGRGVGTIQADAMIDAIEKSEAFASGRLEDISELALYVEGVNRDKVSDLTTNLIRSQLVQYTGDQCASVASPTFTTGFP